VGWLISFQTSYVGEEKQILQEDMTKTKSRKVCSLPLPLSLSFLKPLPIPSSSDSILTCPLQTTSTLVHLSLFISTLGGSLPIGGLKISKKIFFLGLVKYGTLMYPTNLIVYNRDLALSVLKTKTMENSYSRISICYGLARTK
jgi:hypothetical protein